MLKKILSFLYLISLIDFSDFHNNFLGKSLNPLQIIKFHINKNLTILYRLFLKKYYLIEKTKNLFHYFDKIYHMNISSLKQY